MSLQINKPSCLGCKSALDPSDAIGGDRRSSIDGGSVVYIECSDCGTTTTVCSVCMGRGRYRTANTDEWVACYNCPRS